MDIGHNCRYTLAYYPCPHSAVHYPLCGVGCTTPL